MAEHGFPGQHTTTTTVTSNTMVQTNLRFDLSYLRTPPGILKLVQIILNLLGFICVATSGHSYHSRGSFFDTVAMFGFWFTGILLGFYLFHVIEKFHKIPWLKIEFIYCLIICVFYLIASSLAADFPSEAFAVAAFFGFCAMVAYGIDAFLKFRALKAGQIAQGERIVNRQQTTTITTPTY